MEKFYENEKKDFESRINDSFQKLLEKEMEATSPLSEEQVRMIEAKKRTFADGLSVEAKDFLERMPDEEFNEIPFLILKGAHLYDNDMDEKISLDHLRNVLLYRKVYGYGHPELEKRKEENPIPSASEVLLGCYKEQIEKQARTAVFELRSKGYDTMQSGFYNKKTGSQFFDIYESDSIAIPEELKKQMNEKFNVDIRVEDTDDRTTVEFVPQGFKTLEEWEKALGWFSQQIPSSGEESFLSSGMGVGFAYNTIRHFPLEEILKTARDSHEADLIRKLYECKTKEDVIRLFGIEPVAAEKMIIEDLLEEELAKNLPEGLKDASKEIRDDFNIGAVMVGRKSIQEHIDSMRKNMAYISENHREKEETRGYLKKVERALEYLEKRLRVAK